MLQTTAMQIKKNLNIEDFWNSKCSQKFLRRKFVPNLTLSPYTVEPE